MSLGWSCQLLPARVPKKGQCFCPAWCWCARHPNQDASQQQPPDNKAALNGERRGPLLVVRKKKKSEVVKNWIHCSGCVTCDLVSTTGVKWLTADGVASLATGFNDHGFRKTCWRSSRTVTSLSQSDMQNLGALNQPDHYGSSDEFTGLAWFFYRYLTLVLPGIFPPQGIANILRFFNKTLTFYKTLVFFFFHMNPLRSGEHCRLIKELCPCKKKKKKPCSNKRLLS